MTCKSKIKQHLLYLISRKEFDAVNKNVNNAQMSCYFHSDYGNKSK